MKKVVEAVLSIDTTSNPPKVGEKVKLGGLTVKREEETVSIRGQYTIPNNLEEITDLVIPVLQEMGAPTQLLEQLPRFQIKAVGSIELTYKGQFEGFMQFEGMPDGTMKVNCDLDCPIPNVPF